MEVCWRDGVVWIVSDAYEGPADLMNFFLARGKLPPANVAVQPLLDALLPLLGQLPLEERMEVLLFLAHLLFLKARALLPALPDEAPPAPESPSPPTSLLSPLLLQAWENAIRQAQGRLARPAAEDITPLPFLKPVSQMDILRAYLAVLAAQEKRQRRYAVQPPPLSIETVAQDLERYFAHTPQTTLSALFASFPRNALYWAVGLFLILSWIQEERLRYEPTNLWNGQLTWVEGDS